MMDPSSSLTTPDLLFHCTEMQSNRVALLVGTSATKIEPSASRWEMVGRLGNETRFAAPTTMAKRK